MAKKERVTISIPNGSCIGDGEHFYRVTDNKILHVIRDIEHPLINIVEEIRGTDLYHIDEEYFNIVLNEAILNLGLLNEVRNAKIEKIIR